MKKVVEILWPDRRVVSENQIKVWASDALANEAGIMKLPHEISFEEAIEIVNHYGYATTKKD
jgi:hypothetical protein